MVQDFGNVFEAIDRLLDSCFSDSSKTVLLSNKGETLDSATQLILTKLSSKLAPKCSRILSDLLVKLLDVRGGDERDGPPSFQRAFLDVLRFSVQFDPILAIPDALVSQSLVMDGICANLSAAGSLLLPKRDRKAKVRFVAIEGSLEDLSLESVAAASVAVGSEEEYLRVTGGFEAVVRERLERYRTRWGVGAIVSTRRFGDKVRLLAMELGMELFFCPEESQVRRLCAAFGIECFFSSGFDRFEENTLMNRHLIGP